MPAARGTFPGSRARPSTAVSAAAPAGCARALHCLQVTQLRTGCRSCLPSSWLLACAKAPKPSVCRMPAARLGCSAMTRRRPRCTRSLWQHSRGRRRRRGLRRLCEAAPSSRAPPRQVRPGRCGAGAGARLWEACCGWGLARRGGLCGAHCCNAGIVLPVCEAEAGISQHTPNLVLSPAWCSQQ